MKNQSSSLADQFNQLNRILPNLLAGFLADKRWFGGKARRIRAIRIEDIVSITDQSSPTVIAFTLVVYEDGQPETYAIPLITQEAGSEEAQLSNHEVAPGNNGVMLLKDALQQPGVLRSLYDAIERETVFPGRHGEICAFKTTAFTEVSLSPNDLWQPRLISGEQSNSSSIFGNRSILKIFRRVQEGVNPELEIGRFLTERAHFDRVAPLGGWLEYKRASGSPMTLGVLQGFISNEGDAWQYTLRSLSGFWPKGVNSFSEIMSSHFPEQNHNPHDVIVPAIADEVCGPYLDRAALLGRRTAEMHTALASDNDHPAFAPEPYTAEFQRQIESSMCANAIETFDLLRSQLPRLSPDMRGKAQILLARANEILASIHEVLRRPLSGSRIRIHGDYHLGQVLCTVDDFMIIDFEGEPGRSIADRSVKRSALQDVAGMLRSFQYVATAPLLTKIAGVDFSQEENSKLFTLAEHWNKWVSNRFLKAYFQTAGSCGFLPEGDREIGSLLRLNMVAKALFEISYELNNRPEWIRIPLNGILQLLDQSDAALPLPSPGNPKAKGNAS